MATSQVTAVRPLIAMVSGCGTNYCVETPSGVKYIVYVDVNSDVAFIKSTDSGFTWSTPTVVYTGTVTQLSIWYDRWSGISAGLIHCAYTNSGNSDCNYRTIDTENSDTLGTEATIFAGASTASGGALSITRARGGNVYCKVMIDAGAEGGFARLLNANVSSPSGNWVSRTDSEALATTDQWILLPGWAADNQDIMMFFWDQSASEIDRVLYDDSGDSWALTNIVGTYTTPIAFSNWAATVDTTNSQNLLVAWSASDSAGADLRLWKVTESAITEGGSPTSVVADSTDDQGICSIGIDTDTQDWYVFYGGASGGTETFATSVNIYQKVSTDDGATWGSETQITVSAFSLQMIMSNPRFATNRTVCIYNSTGARLDVFVDAVAAATGGQRVFGG
jgi:hypothetical protein